MCVMRSILITPCVSHVNAGLISPIIQSPMTLADQRNVVTIRMEIVLAIINIEEELVISVNWNIMNGPFVETVNANLKTQLTIQKSVIQ